MNHMYLLLMYDKTPGASKTKIQEKRHVFSKKLSTGSRFIIKDASLVYKAASTTGYYHANMNFDNYVKWLNEKLLPNIPEKSVVVMDNASYHNTRSSKIPISNSCKSNMQKWLMENNIPFDEMSRNIELWDLI